MDKKSHKTYKKFIFIGGGVGGLGKSFVTESAKEAWERIAKNFTGSKLDLQKIRQYDVKNIERNERKYLHEQSEVYSPKLIDLLQQIERELAH